MHNKTHQKEEYPIHNEAEKLSLVDLLLVKVIPTLGVVLMVLSYIPQIYLTYTTQNVSGQSVGFWLLLSGGLLGMWTNLVVRAIRDKQVDMIGIVFQSINLSLAIIMLVAVIIFK